MNRVFSRNVYWNLADTRKDRRISLIREDVHENTKKLSILGADIACQ